MVLNTSIWEKKHEVNKEKLLQTISPDLKTKPKTPEQKQEEVRNPVTSHTNKNTEVKDHEDKSRDENTFLCYQKPSSPVTCLAKTRKIQVIQSINCNHSGIRDNDNSSNSRHGGSHRTRTSDIEISSKRDLTASTPNKTMVSNGLENYKLTFRNRVRGFEDANRSDNQSNNVSNSINNQVNSQNAQINQRSVKYGDGSSPKFYNQSNKSVHSKDYFSSENKFKANSHLLEGSHFSHAYNDVENRSFRNVVTHSDLRDGNFRETFKQELPSSRRGHLNEFSNPDEMYTVAKYPPSYTLTQMTTSVAVEFFAR
ncbi:hypothetical protein WDU94_014405 [Cyamophila willieti]